MSDPIRRVRITIPGKPFAKQRPRFDGRSGRAYTPGATVSFERTVGTLAAQAVNQVMNGPVRVTVRAYFAPAKSWTKRRRQDALGKPHLFKPDADNLIKAVLDGLNRIAFPDDAQVFSQLSEKYWDLEERTEILIEEFAAA